MKPNGGGRSHRRTSPQPINAGFGDFDAFKTQFNDAGAKRFGTGWAWLVATGAASCRS